MTTIAREDNNNQAQIAVGVDTHRDTHTAAVIDSTGRMLGSAQFPADPSGYRSLLEWAVTFGVLLIAAIEGTGAYGAGLARYLISEGVDLVEIDRPDRRIRRLAGKSDPIDAEAAARTGLARARTGTPKDRTGKSKRSATSALLAAARSISEQTASAASRPS